MEYFYVDGYAFSTKEEYNLAARELRNVSAIRAKMDLTNKDSVLSIYKRLVAKNMLVTPIGIDFLRELRRRLIDEFGVEEVDIPNIKVVKKEDPSKARSEKFTKEQLLKENESLSSKNRTKNIFIVGLIVVVLGMFAISLLSPYSGYVNYENKVLNKYSSWEEQLKEREQAVKDKEAELGIDADDSSDTSDSSEN